MHPLPAAQTSLRLGTPLAIGERLLVPVVRLLTLSHAKGGMLDCTPVALLIGENGAWSFVSLEEGITQEVLEEPGLLPPGV